MSPKINVRWSPSPSGFCHIGGARTALFNWAYARKNGGTFIVRVEDTDQARSTPESEKNILDSLRWLGIDWDEGVDVGGPNGPYRQSERKDIYKFYAEKLIKEGKAYRCYCTEEDLKLAREEWTKNNPKVGFKYPGTCKDKPQDLSRPHVIRLVSTREGVTEFTDKAYGKISTPNCENQDWVIIRTDGLPLYNFGAVVDDALMKITLVARGADHLQNTIPQILMYNALGFEIPEFCHLGLIRGLDNEKLSKRHASVSVFEYRDNGYSPAALLNYLARLGWAKGNAEVFSMQEFIDMFDWTGCGNKDGKWDSSKLNAVQFAHLKNPNLVSKEEYASRVIPFLRAKRIETDQAVIENMVELVRSRAKNFIEAANELEPILTNNITVDSILSEKFIAPTKDLLNRFQLVLSSLEDWNEESIKNTTMTWLNANGLVLKDIGQPTRVSLVGKTNSPELFQVMAALGKTKTIERIAKNL